MANYEPVGLVELEKMSKGCRPRSKSFESEMTRRELRALRARVKELECAFKLLAGHDGDSCALFSSGAKDRVCNCGYQRIMGTLK